MIVLDASALIAMIAGEEDADQLADRLATDPHRICSAIARWETVAGLCRSYRISVEAADKLVLSFMTLNDIQPITIGDIDYHHAIVASANFGKGRHPAALNMGDCFAYGCAKANDAALLFKGSDFSLTDIALAGV